MADVFKILELNTAHLPETTAQKFDNPDLLADEAFKRPVCSGEYGWLFVVPSDAYNMDMVHAVGCAAFTACIERAQNLGCSYILFDNIHNIDETLPVFDW